MFYGFPSVLHIFCKIYSWVFFYAVKAVFVFLWVVAIYKIIYIYTQI